MKFFYIILFFFCFSINQSIAQIMRCGSSIQVQKMEDKIPNYKSYVEKTFDWAKSNEANRGEIYTIPVVVHVIYNTPEQNISDDLINDQMEVLNQDFRRTNADASLTRDLFVDIAGDTEIEFALAKYDPQGNETSGITRTQTDVPSFVNFDITTLLQAVIECGIDLASGEFTDEQLACLTELLGTGLDLDAPKSSDTGGVDPWDVNNYLNIWVCNMAIDIGGMSAPFILGFAYPPVGAPNWPTEDFPPDYFEKDGVTIHYQAFGPNNPEAGTLAGINDKGRTATHEVGHYLGLRHIWGDGDCSMDDGIDDTPPAGENSQPTTTPVPTCEQMHDKDSCVDDMLPDMIENYMDYSMEHCQNMFTKEQSQLMRSMLEGPRNELITNVPTSYQSIRLTSLSISPNPFGEILNVKLDRQSKGVLELFNLQGQSLVVQTFINDVQVNTQKLNAGAYIIVLTLENGEKFVHKCIKQ